MRQPSNELYEPLFQIINPTTCTHLSQVITSSFAAMVDLKKGNRPGYVYSEKDWNPITEEAALENPSLGYYGSKTFAETAAWNFVEKEKPNFTLATVNISTPCPLYVVYSASVNSIFTL